MYYTTTDVRKMTSYGTGIADYVSTGDHAPAWLISAVEGAAEAKAEWEAENAKGRTLNRERRQLDDALLKLRRDPDVLASELEAAERAHRAKERAVDAQARRSLAALKRFDATVHGDNVNPEEHRKLAAAHALKKHAEAAAAWEVVKAALAERDQARVAAGNPGRHWTDRANVGVTSPLGSAAKSERILDARIEAFDVDSVKRAANGEKVKSDAELAAEAKAMAKEAIKASAAAARKRSAAQGFN